MNESKMGEPKPGSSDYNSDHRPLQQVREDAAALERASEKRRLTSEERLSLKKAKKTSRQ